MSGHRTPRSLTIRIQLSKSNSRLAGSRLRFFCFPMPQAMRLTGIQLVALLCHTFGESINPLFRVFGPFFRRFLVAPRNCQSEIAPDDKFLDLGLGFHMRQMMEIPLPNRSKSL